MCFDLSPPFGVCGKSFTFDYPLDILIGVERRFETAFANFKESDEMPEKESNLPQSDFMIEKIKERPISRRKLLRRTLITVAMAVIFGLVACFTFFALEPVLSNWMNPKETLPPVYFPEEKEEMSPEEMMSDNIPPEASPSPNGNPENPEGITLSEEQIQNIFAAVRLDLTNYGQLYSALSDYTAELKKSMVTLTGISSRVDWFNDINESAKRSSGIIIANNTKELLILADFSPLEDAQRLNVTFYNGAETTAELRQRDATTNLAVLSIPLEVLSENFLNDLAIAKIGSSNYINLTGTPVVALGNPMGTNNSVGYGVITSDSAQSYETDVNYKLLQTDIVGSPAADGVLFNLRGQVLGIITCGHNGEGMQNLITAYGISDLKRRMEKLSNQDPFAYAGIYGMSVSLSVHKALDMPYGAYVKEVVMESPAMRAGIRQGDVIIQMNEIEIKNFSDYVSFIELQKPEKEILVKVMRQSQNEYKEMNLKIILGELPKK